MSEYKTLSILGTTHSHFELSKIVDYHIDTSTHEIDGVRVAPMAAHSSDDDDDDDDYDDDMSAAADRGRSAALTEDVKRIANCRDMVTLFFDSDTASEIGLDVPTVRSRVDNQIRHWYLLINQLEMQNRQLREKLKTPKVSSISAIITAMQWIELLID